MAKIPKLDDYLKLINCLIYDNSADVRTFVNRIYKPEPVYKVKINDAIEVEYEVNDVYDADEHEDLYLTD